MTICSSGVKRHSGIRLLSRNFSEPELIQDIKEEIKDFDIGDDFIAVCTTSNKYFSRGINNLGQCGTGKKDRYHNQWTSIEFLNDRETSQICCGLNHVVYGSRDSRCFEHRQRLHEHERCDGEVKRYCSGDQDLIDKNETGNFSINKGNTSVRDARVSTGKEAEVRNVLPKANNEYSEDEDYEEPSRRQPSPEEMKGLIMFFELTRRGYINLLSNLFDNNMDIFNKIDSKMLQIIMAKEARIEAVLQEIDKSLRDEYVETYFLDKFCFEKRSRIALPAVTTMKITDADPKKGPREQIARTYQLTQSLMKLFINLDHEEASNDRPSEDSVESGESSVETESQVDAHAVFFAL